MQQFLVLSDTCIGSTLRLNLGDGTPFDTGTKILDPTLTVIC